MKGFDANVSKGGVVKPRLVSADGANARRRSDLRKFDPLRAQLGRLHDGFDEGHAFDAVVNGGEVEVLG